jgi:hypothetical protein
MEFVPPLLQKITILYRAHHKNNVFCTKPSQLASKMHGIDNTEDLQLKLDAKSQLVRDFFLEMIRANHSFMPAGMAELSQLKTELYTILANLGKILTNLHAILNMLTALNDGNIQQLVAQSKSVSLKDWCSRSGFAIIDGKPKAKVVSNTPFRGGVYSTVCFAPDCTTMVCHEGCSIQFTGEKGNNVFIQCTAFQNMENCKSCAQHCTYKQHVHTQCTLEWVENDTIATTFYAIKEGVTAALGELDRLKVEGINISVLQFSYLFSLYS